MDSQMIEISGSNFGLLEARNDAVLTLTFAGHAPVAIPLDDFSKLLKDYAGTIDALVRSFVAVRVSLGASVDHADENITDAELVAAIKRAKTLRGSVSDEVLRRYATVLQACVQNREILDTETIITALGGELSQVKVLETSRG
jgi:hypothetical protein